MIDVSVFDFDRDEKPMTMMSIGDIIKRETSNDVRFAVLALKPRILFLLGVQPLLPGGKEEEGLRFAGVWLGQQ